MADYSTIKGFTVQSLASDPYATSIAAGTWASGTAPPSGQLTATEEFNFANTVKTVTVS